MRLVRAVSVDDLCDALATPAIEAAHVLGRLRVDVDPPTGVSGEHPAPKGPVQPSVGGPSRWFGKAVG